MAATVSCSQIRERAADRQLPHHHQTEQQHVAGEFICTIIVVQQLFYTDWWRSDSTASTTSTTEQAFIDQPNRKSVCVLTVSPFTSTDVCVALASGSCTNANDNTVTTSINLKCHHCQLDPGSNVQRLNNSKSSATILGLHLRAVADDRAAHKQSDHATGSRITASLT